MLKQELQQKQSLSPQQILEATLLQLNNSSLDKYILEEFEKNPILEPSETVRDDSESNLKEDENDDWDGLLLKYGENGDLISKKIYDKGEVTEKFNIKHEVTKPKIIELLESRPNEKLSDEDVNRFLKYGN